MTSQDPTPTIITKPTGMLCGSAGQDNSSYVAQMARLLYMIVDFTIVILCLPFYAVMALCDAIKVRGKVYRLVRFLRRVPPLVLSRQQAEAIASEEFERRGWKVRNTDVEELLRGYFVRNDAGIRPPQGWVMIDGYTGDVLESCGPALR